MGDIESNNNENAVYYFFYGLKSPNDFQEETNFFCKTWNDLTSLIEEVGTSELKKHLTDLKEALIQYVMSVNFSSYSLQTEDTIRNAFFKIFKSFKDDVVALLNEIVYTDEKVFTALSQIFFALQDMECKNQRDSFRKKLDFFQEKKQFSVLNEPLSELTSLMSSFLQSLAIQGNELKEKINLSGDEKRKNLNQYCQLNEFFMGFNLFNIEFIEKCCTQGLGSVANFYQSSKVHELVQACWNSLKLLLEQMIPHFQAESSEALVLLVNRLLVFIRDDFFNFFNPDQIEDNTSEKNWLIIYKKYKEKFNLLITDLNENYFKFFENISPNVVKLLIREKNQIADNELLFSHSIVMKKIEQLNSQWKDKVKCFSKTEEDIFSQSHIPASSIKDEADKKNDDLNNRFSVPNFSDSSSEIDCDSEYGILGWVIDDAKVSINEEFYQKNEGASNTVMLFFDTTNTIIQDLIKQMDEENNRVVILLEKDLECTKDNILYLTEKNSHKSSEDLIEKRYIIEIALKLIQQYSVDNIPEDVLEKAKKLIDDKSYERRRAILLKLESIANFQEQLLATFFPKYAKWDDYSFVENVNLMAKQLENRLTNFEMFSKQLFTAQELSVCTEAIHYLLFKVYDRSHYFDNNKDKLALARVLGIIKKPHSLWNPLNLTRWCLSRKYRDLYSKVWHSYEENKFSHNSNMNMQPSTLLNPLNLMRWIFSAEYREEYSKSWQRYSEIIETTFKRETCSLQSMIQFTRLVPANEKNNTNFCDDLNNFLLGKTTEEAFLIKLETEIEKAKPGSLWLPWNWGWTKSIRLQRECYNNLVQIHSNAEHLYIHKVCPERIAASSRYYVELNDEILKKQGRVWERENIIPDYDVFLQDDKIKYASQENNKIIYTIFDEQLNGQAEGIRKKCLAGEKLTHPQLEAIRDVISELKVVPEKEAQANDADINFAHKKLKLFHTEIKKDPQLQRKQALQRLDAERRASSRLSR